MLRRSICWLESLPREERRDSIASLWLPAEDAGVLIDRPATASSLAADPEAMKAILDGGHVAPIEPSKPFAPSAPAGERRVHRDEATAGVAVYRGAGNVPILVRLKPASLLTHVGV